MRSSLPGYYQPTKEEFEVLWKNCVFAFDASVLLDLYRSTAKTRKTLLDILERIQDRIWVPYQAALEYQENRLKVVAEEQAVHTELRESLNALANSFKQKMENHAIENADRIATHLENARKNIEEIINQAAKDYADLRKSDRIRDQLTKLFEGRTGNKYEDKRMAEIYSAGAKRYEQKTPPGYEDAKKGGTRQYGDLVAWNAILDYAKDKKCPIIFVTSDAKEDWWWKQGQFTIGPRPELVEEMLTLSGQGFYMYNVERFLEQAERRLDTKMETGDVKKAAEEFKEIEEKRKEQSAEYVNLLLRKALLERTGIKNRLIHIPSSDWAKVPITDFIKGIQALERRVLAQPEIDYVFKMLQSKDVMTSVAHAYNNCWAIVRFFDAMLTGKPRHEETTTEPPLPQDKD